MKCQRIRKILDEMSQHLTNKQNSVLGISPHGREIPLYNFHPASVKKQQPRAFYIQQNRDVWRDLKVSVKGRKVFKVACQR